jgi:hypothetical protein
MSNKKFFFLNLIVIFGFLLGFATFPATAQKSLRALFLGNSYTASNNLPQMISRIAHAMGDSLYYTANTPGGYTFSGHCTNATSLSMIAAGPWDYVILQEQSQIPSLSDAEVDSLCFPFARRLDSLIRVQDSCTETMFFMTWGRKNGDASNCAVWPPVCTFEGMQERLRKSYLQMGADHHASVAPVGMAWAAVRQMVPSFDLWSPDESHPSLHGSYLTACVFYTMLFHKSTEACTYTAGLTPADALLLQQVASATVYDSLQQWAGNGDPAWAGFSALVNGYDVTFHNQSVNAQVYTWDFGDGQISSLEEPLHSYSVAGDYLVTLMSQNDCFSDTLRDSVHVLFVGQADEKSLKSLKFSPNPSDGTFIGDVGEMQGFAAVYNVRGVLLMRCDLREISIHGLDLRSYPAGVYFLRINDNPDVYRLLKR